MGKLDPLNELKETVKFMDRLSQEGFSEISSIAKLLLYRLETEEDFRGKDETVISVLSLIWSKAVSIENCINGAAENVGCNYSSRDERWRSGAFLMTRAQSSTPSKTEEA